MNRAISLAARSRVSDALAVLSELAGNRETIDTVRLEHLGIFRQPPGWSARWSLSYCGESVVVGVDDPVVTYQNRVEVATIRRKLRLLDEGIPLEMCVTDCEDDGRWWKVDGLHRLAASRLVGISIQASIYR